MPPLRDMLSVKSLPGFETEPTTPTIIQTARLGINAFRRCPLPPFSATPDTLRQFNETGPIPARRVIPLPVQTSGTGSGTVTETVTTSTSSSSSGSVITSLVAASATLSIPSLTAGQVYTTSVVIAKAFQLQQLTSTAPLEVRLYGSSLAQTIDVSRLTDTAPPFEVTSGLITDIVFDTSPYQWGWQNRVVANADSPQTSTLYVTVVNYGTSGTSAATISVTYLPMET